MGKTEIRWGIAVFVLVSLILFVVARSPRKRVTSIVGQQAPPISFEYKGNQHTLQDYIGKAVLVNFWAGWCRPCMEEMPTLRNLENKFAEKGLVLLAINVSGEPYDIVKDIPAEQLPLVRIHQFNEDDLAPYKVEVIPHSVLIDRKGTVREVFVGPRKWDGPQVEAIVRGVLDKS